MSTIACQRCMFRSSLKAIARVDNKIDYMLLQRRQIIKSVENRKDIQDPGNIKYAITSFDYIVRAHPHHWHDALCH